MNKLQSYCYMCLHKTLQLDGSTVLQYCVCHFLEKLLQNPWIYIFNCTRQGLWFLLKNIRTHSLHAALVTCLTSSTKVSIIVIIYCKRLVSLLRQIATGLSEWSHGFSSGQAVLWVFRFSFVTLIPPMLPTCSSSILPVSWQFNVTWHPYNIASAYSFISLHKMNDNSKFNSLLYGPLCLPYNQRHFFNGIMYMAVLFHLVIHIVLNSSSCKIR